MIDWNKIPSQYQSEPVNHFRISKVFSDGIYTELLDTYLHTWGLTTKGFYDPSVTYPNVWQNLYDYVMETRNVVPELIHDHLEEDLHQDYIITNLQLSNHIFPDLAPGELIRGWHRDGSTKYFNMVIYFDDETHGNIEFKNVETEQEKSYLYEPNSAVMWANCDHRVWHQFRNSGSGVRKTLFITWAPNTEEMTQYMLKHDDYNLAEIHQRQLDLQCNKTVTEFSLNNQLP